MQFAKGMRGAYTTENLFSKIYFMVWAGLNSGQSLYVTYRRNIVSIHEF